MLSQCFQDKNRTFVLKILFHHKIKKKFYFIDNFENNKIEEIKKKNKLNLIISKSGNTLETIVNSNVIIKKAIKNIFITEVLIKVSLIHFQE